MSDHKTEAFDFDGWMLLARKDVAAFEKLRAQVIQEYIASVSIERRSRLRRLQWRVDTERRLAGTPDRAFRRVFGMMWESVYGERGLDRAIKTLLEPMEQTGRAVTLKQALPKAKVLELPGNGVAGPASNCSRP